VLGEPTPELVDDDAEVSDLGALDREPVEQTAEERHEALRDGLLGRGRTPATQLGEGCVPEEVLGGVLRPEERDVDDAARVRRRLELERDLGAAGDRVERELDLRQLAADDVAPRPDAALDERIRPLGAEEDGEPGYAAAS